MKKIVTPCILLLIVSCNTNTDNLTKFNAYIFERKIRTDGKLLISYAFSYGKKIIKDSVVVNNMVLPQDSVSIVFKKNNPAKSDLLLQPGN